MIARAFGYSTGRLRQTPWIENALKSTVLFYVRISNNSAKRYKGETEKPKVSRTLLTTYALQ